MTETHRTEDMHIGEARERLIAAALPHVPFDGWSKAALDAAIAETGVDPGLARLAFPRGGIDLAAAWHRQCDRVLAERLADAGLPGMKVRERVTLAVRTRLDLMDGNREAVRRSAAMFALPMHAAEGAKLIWETSDAIWRALGDPSEDYNWYTKRLILASVYASVVLYWLGDESAGHARTLDFLDRRIEDVMRFEKTKAQLSGNPLVKAAMWGPSKLLGLVRAPGTARPEGW